MFRYFVAKSDEEKSYLRYPFALWIGCQIFLASFCFASAIASSPTVEIEVIHEGSQSLLAPQEWAEVLGRAGFARVSIRGRRSGDTPGVENVGSSQVPRYRVTAVLRNDKIILPPSEQFNKRDLGKIKAWIAKLQKGGLGAPGNLQDPFGLSATQLDLLRKQMAVHVDANAKDKQRDQVIDRLLANQNFSVAMDARMRQKSAQGGAVSQEFAGLATGTALAAILRPVGLGLQPGRDRPTWTVITKMAGKEVWPVGWDSDQSAVRTVPILGKQVETQVVTLPLNDALAQLAARMEVPLLLDYRELAVEKIDPKAPVSMRAGRFLYSAVIRHLLRQHQLSFAVRLDDSAQPFLWVSTYNSLKAR